MIKGLVCFAVIFNLRCFKWSGTLLRSNLIIRVDDATSVWSFDKTSRRYFPRSGVRFGPENPFVKQRPANSVKQVFSQVVKGITINIIAKFRASRRLHFEDTRKIKSPEKFRDFRETGSCLTTWVDFIALKSIMFRTNLVNPVFIHCPIGGRVKFLVRRLVFFRAFPNNHRSSVD